MIAARFDLCTGPQGLSARVLLECKDSMGFEIQCYMYFIFKFTRQTECSLLQIDGLPFYKLLSSCFDCACMRR